MPGSGVPPDPNCPVPIAWETGDPYTAFRLDLDGMYPHSEQSDTRFEIESKAMAVFMLSHDTGYKYRGIGVRDLSHLGTLSKAKIWDKWVPNGDTKTVKESVSSTSWNGSVTAMSHIWLSQYTKAKLTVTAIPPSGVSNTYAVVVPYLEIMRNATDFTAYLGRAGWAALGTGKTTVDITVTSCQQNDTYVAFVAVDPGGANLAIHSAAMSIVLT